MMFLFQPKFNVHFLYTKKEKGEKISSFVLHIIMNAGPDRQHVESAPAKNNSGVENEVFSRDEEVIFWLGQRLFHSFSYVRDYEERRQQAISSVRESSSDQLTNLLQVAKGLSYEAQGQQCRSAGRAVMGVQLYVEHGMSQFRDYTDWLRSGTLGKQTRRDERLENEFIGRKLPDVKTAICRELESRTENQLYMSISDHRNR